MISLSPSLHLSHAELSFILSALDFAGQDVIQKEIRNHPGTPEAVAKRQAEQVRQHLHGKLSSLADVYAAVSEANAKFEAWRKQYEETEPCPELQMLS